MARRKILVHRYDNEPDILAVAANGCSDVPTASQDTEFDLVVVIPTRAARTEFAVLADATSHQYKIRDGKQKHWPGSPNVKYTFRVDVTNVRCTSLTKVRNALEKAGEWVGQWTVKNVTLEEDDLVDPDGGLDF